jgi:hypothetical protein
MSYSLAIEESCPRKPALVREQYKGVHLTEVVAGLAMYLFLLIVALLVQTRIIILDCQCTATSSICYRTMRARPDVVDAILALCGVGSSEALGVSTVVNSRTCSFSRSWVPKSLARVRSVDDLNSRHGQRRGLQSSEVEKLKHMKFMKSITQVLPTQMLAWIALG